MTPDDIHQLIQAVIQLVYLAAGVLAHRLGATPVKP